MFSNRLVVFALVAVCLNVSLTSAKRCLFMFGDSLSDQGRIFRLSSKGKFPSPKPVPLKGVYYNGRFTNGPNWVDWIDKEGADVQTFNFAYGGATACQIDGTSAKAGIPTIQKQAQEFVKLGKSSKLSKCSERVAIFWGGHNDVIAARQGNQSSVFSAAKTVADISSCLGKAVSTVADSGLVDKVLVGTLFPLGRVPSAAAVQNNVVLSKLAKTLTVALNTKLTLTMDALDFFNWNVDISIWPLHDDMDVWLDQYKENGFTHGTDVSCVVMNPGEGALSGTTPRSVCKDPNNYLFFDAVHATTNVHKYIASSLNKALADSKFLSKPLF